MVKPVVPHGRNFFKGSLLALLGSVLLLRCDFFDIIPPEVSIVSPTVGQAHFGTFPLEIIATDNRSVDRVEVFLNGNPVHEFTKSPYKVDIDFDQISGTSATLKAVAYDQADNSADATVEVSLTLGLKITSPNGGEVWAEQSTQSVSWESSGNVGSAVHLEYSVDDGTTWQEISSSTPNDGEHPWTLPNLFDNATSCLVRLNSTSSSFADSSGAVFTIMAEANFLALTSPNGGEVWAEQSTHDITWTFGGDVGDDVSLDYSLDNGSSWNQIAASTPNDGSHIWTLPNFFTSSTISLLRISSTTAAIADTSNANFTISAEPNFITLTSPNGGEVWAEQSTQTITWTSGGDVGDNVSLHYSLDAGSTWDEIVASTVNDGSHAWTLPGLVASATSTRVKITSTTTAFSDSSDADFVITDESITLISPNGGELIHGWNEFPITWTSTSGIGSEISIFYSLGSERNWIEISSTVLNTGNYSWFVPNVFELRFGGNIMISSNISSHSDISDSDFFIDEWVATFKSSIVLPDPRNIFFANEFAYVADDDSGLYIVNILDPSNPSIVGKYSINSRAWDVYVRGDYAYIASGQPPLELQIVNISNPSNPTLVSSFPITGNPNGISVVGDYAYIAAFLWGVYVIGISDPSTPYQASHYSGPFVGARDVIVEGNYAYVAWGSSGFQILDISNPPSLTLIGTHDTPGRASEIYLNGNHLYVTLEFVTNETSGLYIYDVSSPSAPTLIGKYENPPINSNGVYVSNNYAFMAHDKGLQVLDVSDPTKPLPAAKIGFGFSRKVRIRGNYAYVLSGNYLTIFEISQIPGFGSQ